jgi:hypothetical protein
LSDFEKVFGAIGEYVSGSDFDNPVELLEMFVFVGIEVAEGGEAAESRGFA